MASGACHGQERCDEAIPCESSHPQKIASSLTLLAMTAGVRRAATFGIRAVVSALLLIVTVFPLACQAAELKLATWNLDWLTERPAHDPALPPDVHARTGGDFDHLRQYAAELDADVIALQEVETVHAVARVFPPDRYVLRLTHDDVVQRVGFAVRRGIAFTANPDLVDLQPAPELRLRSGADITLHLGATSLRLLAVHLKTGCRDQRLGRRGPRACAELAAQIPALQDWIAKRREEQVGFVVLGDFNRTLEAHDQFWTALRRAAPLTRATAGAASPCWGGESFIDHIIAGGPAREWLRPETLRVLTYRETSYDWRDRLSDHCPVAVRLRVPE